MKLLIVTLGYDVKFQIKGVMKTTPKVGDHVLILKPLQEDEKSKRAEDEFRNFITRFFEDVQITVLKVDVTNPEEAIGDIVRKLFEYRETEDVYVNLSGGMRLLILETLAAVLYVFPPYKIYLELYPENLAEPVRFPIELFVLKPLTSTEIKLLGVLREFPHYTLSELSRELEIPKATLFKRIRGLIEKGYVIERKTGRRVEYKLRPLALALTEKSSKTSYEKN